MLWTWGYEGVKKYFKTLENLEQFEKKNYVHTLSTANKGNYRHKVILAYL